MIDYEDRTPRQVVQELDERIEIFMEQLQLWVRNTATVAETVADQKERIDRLERVVLLSLKMHEADGFYPPSDIMETIRAMKERHPDV